jgi:hypothetical protein
MNTYYVFNIDKIALAEQLLSQRQGQGFFDFKVHQKNHKISDLPNSNVDEDPIILTRPVLILETNFAEEDNTIKAMAEAEAEFLSPESESVHEYLATFDV